MRRMIVLLMAIAAMTAACGGGEDPSDSADAVEDAVQDAAASVDADAVEEAADDAAAAAGSIDADACSEAAEALTAVPQSISSALTGSVDVDAVKAQAQAVAALDVPEQYQADFQVIADTYSEVASTLDEITIEPGTVPDAATQSALTELGTALSSDEYLTASTNLTGYFAAGCQ